MPSLVAPLAMFHTFQGLAPPRPIPEHAQDLPKAANNGTSKRITTPHACAECKRRKIRCDGRQPCGQCLGCRSPKPCYYDKHRQRVIPSRKTLDALSKSLEECRSVLKRLFPSCDPESLLTLSRHDLISLLDQPSQSISLHRAPSQRSPAESNISPTTQAFHSPVEAQVGDDQNLALLEQVPSQDTEWDEERQNRDAIPAEADDVNGLSMSVDRQSSYMGATSIKAAFLVMLKVAPALRSFLAPNNRQVGPPSNYLTSRTQHVEKGLSPIPWSTEGQTLIDAYFKRVQVFIPMLDEPSFRADYLAGRRTDVPWLCLLNMIFCMGSIVANKSDDYSHLNFYARAKDYLTIDTLGSGQLEVLQTFSLMGGLYLHYINRPNLANTILGAALRMACAMGLHRETPQQGNGNALMIEQRRRTWWSLFCLDTWASTTLGRPSMGRWGPGITLRAPEEPANPKALGPDTFLVPMIENIKFCKLATHIQDVLARSPLIRPDERNSLDRQLVEWYDNLPWILRSKEQCGESIYTARCVMKWRYQNLRIVLHRPVLLTLAARDGSTDPTQEELESVAKCRSIAKETIVDIARDWTPNQMLGWNGVWFIYQACMIPLLTILWEHWKEQQAQDCQVQIQMALEALEGLCDWSLAARRSREVVSRMYEASKQLMVKTDPGLATPGASEYVQDRSDLTNGVIADMQSFEGSGHDGPNGILTPSSGVPPLLINQAMHNHSIGLGRGLQQVDMMEHEGARDSNMLGQGRGIWDLDGMLWNNLPDGLDMPYDGLSMDYEENGTYRFDGSGYTINQ